MLTQRVVAYEGQVIRRLGDGVVNVISQPRQSRRERCGVQPLRPRIPALRQDVLAGEDRQPAGRVEDADVVVGKQAARDEGLHLGRQTVRPRHGPHLTPEWFVALVGDIMQHQEVADTLEFQGHDGIVFACVVRHPRLVGKQVQKLRDA